MSAGRASKQSPPVAPARLAPFGVAKASPLATAVAGLTNGRPLPLSTRARMETAFGAPLAHVRVHTDAAASTLTRGVGADAVTIGGDVAFAPGAFRPDTHEGDHLIAHELAHVVQQGAGPGPARMQLSPSEPGDPDERQADAAADRVVRGEPVQVGRAVSTRDRILRKARPGAVVAPAFEPPRRNDGDVAAAPVATTAEASAPAPADARPTPAAAPSAAPTAAAAAAQSAQLEVVTAAPAKDELAAPTAPRGERRRASGGGEPQPAAEAGGRSRLAIEPLMPAPPERLGARAEARLEKAQRAAGKAAAAEIDLPTADDSTSAARAGVTEPSEQLSAQGGNALMDALVQRPEPSPEILLLCKTILARIQLERPESEDAVRSTAPKAIASEVGAGLQTSIDADAQRLTRQYEALGQPVVAVEGQQGVTPEIPPAEIDAPAIGAARAAPDPIPAANLSLDADVAASARRIDDAGMTTAPAQLVQEGPIAAARSAQGDLAAAAASDPARLMAEQQAAIASAQGDMSALQTRALKALDASRKGAVEGTAGQQRDMVGSEEEMRRTLGTKANGIFETTRTQVRILLDPLAATAIENWEAGLAPLITAFQVSIEEVKRIVSERHEGVGGFFVGIADDLTGLPDWIEKRYITAENDFTNGVITLIQTISTDVSAVVAAAEALIEQADKDTDALFTGFGNQLPTWAEEQRAQFKERLAGLSQEAQSTRDGFNKELARRATTAVLDMRDEVQAAREAAAGFLGRVASAIDEFIRDPVRAIINGLLSLLGIPKASFWRLVERLGDVISGIADDPIGFANNLLTAMREGFGTFLDHIDERLLHGLLDWLLGGMAGVGVALPTEFSLRSVVTFFLELMGLTWTNIRVILARHIGEDNAALLEHGYELIASLVAQGPQGIFEMVKGQLDPAVLLDKVMDAAIDFVIDTVVPAVSVRILAMLNPAGAVLQAIEAIYRVIKWVIENAARIFTLVETVVNGAHELLAGNVSGMASAIDSALTRIIPPVLDFFAGFSALGDLPDRIADVVRGMQQWVLGIVDRIMGAVAAQARKLLGIKGKDEPGAEDGGEREFPLTMSGEPHVVTVDLDDDEVRMASKEGKLQDKVAIAERQLEDLRKKDPKTAAEVATRLRRIATKTEAIESKLASGNGVTTKAFQAELKALTNDVLKLLIAYGDRFHVHDLIEPIRVYPSPVLGAHPIASEVASDKRDGRVPDGVTRESHHVPANELAQTLNAGLEYLHAWVEDNPMAEPAAKSIKDRILELGEEGKQLPAILIHPQTHRTGKTAVHSADLRALVERDIARIHREAEQARTAKMEDAAHTLEDAAEHLHVRLKGGGIAINPQGEHWRQFVQEAFDRAQELRAFVLADDATSGDGSSQAIATIEYVGESLRLLGVALNASSEQEEKVIPEAVAAQVKAAIEIAYAAGLQQGTAAIKAALNASVLDGPREQHPTAEALATQAGENAFWNQLRGRKP